MRVCDGLRGLDPCIVWLGAAVKGLKRVLKVLKSGPITPSFLAMNTPGIFLGVIYLYLSLTSLSCLFYPSGLCANQLYER